MSYSPAESLNRFVFERFVYMQVFEWMKMSMIVTMENDGKLFEQLLEQLFLQGNLILDETLEITS